MRAVPKDPMAVVLFRALVVVAGISPLSPAPGTAQGPSNQPVQLPLQVQVTPAPAGPVVTWQPIAGANRYTLHRWTRTGGQGRCCEQEFRSLSGTRFVDTAVPGEGTYIYRLVAHLGGGRRGYQERTVQIGGPGSPARNPSDFAGAQTGPGTVTLRWSPVPRSLFYQLTGPGTGPEGLRVGGTTHVLTGIAEGRQEWQLVTLYPPGTQPDFQNPARASVVVAPADPPTPAAPPTSLPRRDTLQTIAGSPRDLPQRLPPGGGVAPAPTESVPSQPTTADGADPNVGTTAGPSGGQPEQPVASDPTGSRRTLRPIAIRIPDAAPGSPGDPPPAPRASGRYLVTITGLRTGYTTKDGIGIVDVDGKGDEIMAAAFVRRYDRTTAQPLEYTSLQTMVYGDVNGHQSERVQAGRLTRLGGITDGDPIPADAPVARTMPAQASVFPWRLWEGTLTEGADALVISPSIWEFDGNPVDFHAWNQNQRTLTSTLFLSAKLQEQIDGRRFGPLVLGANETSTNRFDATMRFLAEGGIGAAMGLPPLASILGRQRDRAIGLVANDNNSTALPNTTVVLTREIIEDALARPASGTVNPMPFILVPMVKPGLMVINFQDRTAASSNTPFDFLFDRAAFYSMILQVERLP